MAYAAKDTTFDSSHSILECLDRVESFTHPSLVAIRENKRLDTNIVDFKSLYTYATDSGMDTFTEAIDSLKKYNHIQNLTVSIDEAYIYDNPKLVTVFEDFVVKPVSVDSIEYQLCEQYLKPFFNTHNISLLEEYCEKTGLDKEAILHEFQDVDGSYLSKDQLMAKYGSISNYTAAKNKMRTMDNGKNAANAFTNINPNNKGTAGVQATAQRQIDNLQQQINHKVERAKGIARNVQGQVQSGINKGRNLLGDVVSGISNAAGNAKDPSWWARNFAAFKNWMNNNFGTKFNTAIAGYSSYDKWKEMAKNAAQNIVGSQMSDPNSTLNQYKNKLMGKVDQFAKDHNLQNAVNTVKSAVGLNASADIAVTGEILSEVYRPRRMYRSSYMRMH